MLKLTHVLKYKRLSLTSYDIASTKNFLLYKNIIKGNNVESAKNDKRILQLSLTDPTFIIFIQVLRETTNISSFV